jgi:hypothetical protein
MLESTMLDPLPLNRAVRALYGIERHAPPSRYRKALSAHPRVNERSFAIRLKRRGLVLCEMRQQKSTAKARPSVRLQRNSKVHSKRSTPGYFSPRLVMRKPMRS